MQAWSPNLEPAGKVIVVVLALGLVGGWGVYVLRHSSQPGRLVLKWVFTALVLGWMNWQMKQKGFDDNFVRLGVGLAAGLILLATWRHSIADFFAKPFGSLYDGGDAEIEPRPYYSVAEARRKQGRYTEALREIRKQLERFPTDFEGQMMLAEVQAENLNDLPGAELTIHRLCAQRGHAPVNVAHALNMLADWHLKYALDREAARKELQTIVDLLPGSEHAIIAAQRLGHLASTHQLVARHDRHRPVVREGIKNLGLLKTSDSPKGAEGDTDGTAADYVRHLEEHPLDFEVREKLALMYADHYKRMDLATDQLQQMIEMPGQSAKQATHLLNLLADLQVRHGADYDTVKHTLEEILDRYPHTPAAEIARTRLSHLKLEFRAREKTSTVKMGKYEQNIGLKRPA